MAVDIEEVTDRMKTAKPFMVLLLTLLIATATAAAADRVETEPLFLRQNQAGIRLGVWASQGDQPPDSGGISVEGQDAAGYFSTNIKENAFFFEAFYAYRLNSRFMLEIAGGTANRGSVTISNGNASDVGNLVLYPITVQGRFYPLTSPLLGVYPYATAGFGLYIGRRTVQFTNASYYYSNWEEETGFDFDYTVGGGLDWPVASSVGLDLTVKYMPIEFSKSLVAVNDYEALTVTLGIKYLYLK